MRAKGSVAQFDDAGNRRARRPSGGDKKRTRGGRWDGALVGAMCVVGLVTSATLAYPSYAIETRIALALIVIIAAAFHGVSYLVNPARRSLRSRKTWPAIAAAIDVTLASAFIAILTMREGAMPVATGAGVGVYFIALALAAIRLRPGVMVLATALAVAQWAVIYGTLLRPELGPGNDLLLVAIERGIWLIAVGGIASVSILIIRERTHRVGANMERRLERELGRYVSRDVAQDILRGKIHVGKPQRRRVSVLFCDLRGFTFLCERERPEDVVEILDTFYERAFSIVKKHGGTVNKILGDGLLALFGAPHELPSHAAASASAARDIMRMIHRLRDRGGVWTHLAAGIGLDTGDVVVGPIGSRDRAEYTAIGSPVNRAARLQSLAEQERRRIILSEATLRALGKGAPAVELLGEFELKGFAGAERVYYLPFSIGSRAYGYGKLPRQKRDSDQTMREYDPSKRPATD